MLEILSRAQFAITIMFHFIFVPVSIGTILLIAIYETLHVIKKDDKYRKLGDYFGNIFIVMYALGIVTGVAMSLQFGTNWAEYSKFMGDVFGAPLALEALLAFFLESTFTGIWIIARKKISPKFRMTTAWLIWFGTSISSLWIITANGFMQHPVGYEILVEDGSAHVILTSIKELVLNPYTWFMLIHTVASAYLLGAFVIVSTAAAKLINTKTSEYDINAFKQAFKVAGIVALVCAILVPSIGGGYLGYISDVQDGVFEPGELYISEGLSEKEFNLEGIDTTADADGFNVNEVTLDEANKAGKITGSVQEPVTRIAFLIMVSTGVILLIISFIIVAFPKKILQNKSILRITKWIWIIPFIGIYAGWMVTEVGRQPYTVYGLLTTADSISNVPTSQVAFSIISIVILYGVLFVGCVYFLRIQINRPLGYDEYLYPGKYKDSLLPDEEMHEEV